MHIHFPNLRNIHPFLYGLIISTILFLCLGTIPVSASPLDYSEIPEPQPGEFRPTTCWGSIPAYLQETVTCGYVRVPERHSNPDGEKIDLAVMIIHASSDNKQSDPLFFLQGGPGGSTIDTYAEILLTTRPLLTDRDMVLFDQRGTLNSQPSLICSEYDQLLLDTIEKDIPDEEYYQLEEAMYKACRHRLEKEGVDLSAYNSLENAADIQAIRQALGYEQINLYGVSYGTLLALHTMRFYPENIRSVILDAVVPPQTNFILEVPQTSQRAFTQLFDACEQDPSCSKAYPALDIRFYRLIHALNERPVRIPMTDPDTGITYQAVIDGDTFLDGIFQLLYIGELIPAIPKTIVDAEVGNFNFFSRIMSIIVFDRTYSYGMYFSVLCSEDSDFSPSEISLEGVHPQLAASQSDGPEQFLNTCNIWQVEPLDASMDEPVSSSTPVLILSGGFDPITPPEFGQEVSKTLVNSYVIEFPTGGHGAALGGDCQDQIIRSFLLNPSQSPDTNCMQPLESLEFYTPETVIEIPSIIQLLNLQNGREVEFLILFLSGLILLPGIVFIPANYLWKQYKNKPEITPTHQDNLNSGAESGLISYTVPDSPSAQASSSITMGSNQNSNRYTWMVWLFSLLTWLFLISLFIIVALMLSQNDNRLFYGLPGQSRFLFGIPVIMLLLAILMAGAVIRIWLSHDIKLVKKLSTTISFLLCISILVIFGRWEILLALF